jgi:hypothetical protein
MNSPFYLNWKRFWCPREGSYRLTEDGYLLDYDTPSYLTDPNIVTLENLFDVRCLILLGEPGIGKSTEIEKHFKYIKEKTESAGDEFLKFDLKDYQTDQRLFNAIFENPAFKKWQKGENRLYLFLDSLDEALLNINVLSTALPTEIKHLPVERLYFRIASRIADWPVNLEHELKSIWDEPEKQNVLVYELLPLRKRDVEEFAKANDINSNVFIKNIEERDGQPFAIKPVTLSFLTKIYKRDGDIPKTKKEMYIKGSLHLCTEENRSRIASRRSGRLTSEQKMKIAGRIAALSLFSNKATIWIGSHKDDCQEGDLAKQSLYSGRETTIDGIDFLVGPDEVNEALNTGLFSARGQERLGWSHRTYVEFLAAWYLIEHNYEESKILSLISHSGDINQRLTPQLQETAAWLATLSPEIFDILKDRNPEVLLRSDVMAADSSVRASLVEALLTMYASGKLFELAWRDFFQYKKLKHSGLANQLRGFMQDKTQNFRTRRLAIDLAEECACLDLLDELAQIALDRSDLLPIREQAAHAIMKIGDRKTKSKLKALITSSGSDDSNDELRAYGYISNWPDNMTANELFQLISPPKRGSFIGSYSEFLDRLLVQHLKLQDIPVALSWVAKSSENHRMPGDPLNELMNQIMLLGWNNLDEPMILPPFAMAALSRINNHYGVFSKPISLTIQENSSPLEMIEKDDNKRHILVIEILNLSTQVSFDPIYLIFGQTPLIFRKDFDWLITTYVTVKDVSQKTTIANWLSRICDLTNLDQMSTLYGLCEREAIFKEIFREWFDAVEFGTERAIKQKEWFLASQSVDESSPKVDPPLAERIRMQLEKIEQGNVSSWWVLNRELTINEAIARYGNEFEQDITELPGWKSSDNGIKERILSAAKRYISEGEPNNKKWLGKNIIYWPAMAGYRALRLVLKENSEDILEFSAKIWQKWASIILAYPMGNSEKANLLDDTLLKVANIYASDEIKKTLTFSIKKENRKGGWIELSRLNCIWDERLEAVLMRSLKSKNLEPNLFRSILGFLLQHHSQLAQDYIIRKVKSYKTNHKANQKENIAAAIQLLLAHGDEPKWDVIWGVLKEDSELVDDVIGGLAYHHESQKVFSFLSFDQLAELYLFLVKHYPLEDDPKHEIGEGYTVTVRDKIGDWRESILNFMENSGVPEACIALRGLSTELPKYEHLQYKLFRAEFNMRQKTWTPLNETELLDLFLRSDAILIESEQHLLDAVIQSLKKLDLLIQGETPMAISLWNEWNENHKNLYRPKDENRLSDYVKTHLEKELKQRAVIVNREVEIRRGEKTDIRVDAIKKTINNNVYDTVTVIIEVKGCWHRELASAMETQLRDRYLKNNRCRVGLYLIGWFNCDKWDQTDNRYKDSPKYGLSEAKVQFENQAANLCTEDILLRSYVLNLSI